MPLLRDLLDLPDTVRKGDFVLSLARGVDQPEATVRTYAITPALAKALDTHPEARWPPAPSATHAYRLVERILKTAA